MPTFDAMIAVALAGFALSAMPGPSMLYVISHTVGQSRSAGLASALGLCLGGIILAVATALGLAVVLQAQPWLVTALRYIGSTYLVYLGVDMIVRARRDARKPLEVETVQQRSLPNIVLQGIIVEVLNPKTVLFFALFLPPFISGSGGDGVVAQLLVLGVLVPLTAIPSDLLVAYLGGRLAKAVNQKQIMGERMAWAGGFVLIVIAVNLHLNII